MWGVVCPRYWCVVTTAMFTAQMEFFASVSDPAMGGTYVPRTKRSAAVPPTVRSDSGCFGRRAEQIVFASLLASEQSTVLSGGVVGAGWWVVGAGWWIVPGT